MIIPSPLEELKSDIINNKKLKVFVKRDDLIDPVISGNKWRKLKFNIEKFNQGQFEKLLTFGGAYSNHISATARVGKELGIRTIGIIRGEELNEQSNETLKQAAEDGMELTFTRREEYDLRDEKYYHEELRRRHGHIMIVPEGGANYFGMLGCQEITKEIPFEFDYVITACGTGTTAAGLLLGDAKVIGVSTLKGGEFLNDSIQNRLQEVLPDEELTELIQNFELLTSYHFGGYAKYSEVLLDFIAGFESNFNIPLDQVYTGKMMFALDDLIKKDHFPVGSTIIALHTGGIQGKLKK